MASPNPIPPQLKKFALKDVNPTGKQLGDGSFGSVEELRVAGTICAGKKIHALLLDPGNQGWQEMVERFQAECELMSELRHPNLVQFLGLYFQEESAAPVLVIERLEQSLHGFMDAYKSKNIPIVLKTQILFDVAKGLVFLHTRDPAVVHRDLTARNVLLTSSMQAKIADLGNARIINPGQVNPTLTQAPGTLAYMPPEATCINPEYGKPLDIFSFGHLALFVVTQEFPGVLQSATYMVANKLQPRSEIERRQTAFDKMPIQKKHPLAVLIRQCLKNHPDGRPNAESVMRQLEDLVDSDGDHSGMSRMDIVRMMEGNSKPSVPRLKADEIRSGHPGALRVRKITFFGRESWKPYVFEIANSTHLKYSGGSVVKASIPLLDVQAVVPCPELSKPGRFVFEVKIFGKQSRMLAAHTEEERDSWMEAIFMPTYDVNGTVSQLSDKEVPEYEDMLPSKEESEQEEPNERIYDEVFVNPPDTDDGVYETIDITPPIIPSVDRSKPTVSAKPKESKRVHRPLPLAPSPFTKLTDPSQLDMLTEMFQTVDLTSAAQDQSDVTDETPAFRPRSASDPLLSYAIHSFKDAVKNEAEGNDSSQSNVEMGESYDDVFPTASPPEIDTLYNITSRSWTAPLQAGKQSKKTSCPLPAIKESKRLPQYQSVAALQESTKPTHPQQATKKGKKTAHRQFSDESSARKVLCVDTPGTPHAVIHQTTAMRPTPAPRHITTATEEMRKYQGRRLMENADTIEDAKRKNLARQAANLNSHRFLIDDDSDEEVVYVTRPTWAKPRTSTLSPFPLAADLHEEALFIQQSALQNLVKIGQGHFGIVYRAALVKGNGSRCRVAVKTIKKYESDKEMDVFLKEMSIMSSLIHPNIVRLYGIVQNESPWIVLELLPLGDLKNFLTLNTRPVDTLIKYMLDVAMGMHYIAESGLIHRDLAARNIILGENEQCKVSDFGLLRELPPGDDIYVAQDQNSSWPVRWLAPESLRDRQFSSASDIWSFGILQWEMYSPTKLPYDELGGNMQCALQVCEGYRLTVPKEYPSELARIMRACWRKNPRKRPSFRLITYLLTSLSFSD